MSEQIFIFTNPIAGQGRGLSRTKEIQRRLAWEGYAVTAFTERMELIPAEVLRDAMESRAVVVIGGDGTLRAVAERLMSVGRECPPVLVVPLGTANLMGRHLGIQETDEIRLADHLVELIRRRRIIYMDAASANGRFFLLMAGVGLDARIVHEVDRLRNGPIHHTSYLLPSLRALWDYSYPPLSVTVDGRRIFDNVPGMAFVGNVAEYGTGFPLLPLARPDDGVLDVCVIPCATSSEAIRLFLHAAAGEHLQAEGVVYEKGRHIRIESPQPVPVQVDGEAAGHTPLTIDLLPRRLPFIVPEPL